MKLNIFAAYSDSEPAAPEALTVAEVGVLKAGSAQLVSNTFSMNVNLWPDPWDHAATVLAFATTIKGNLHTLETASAAACQTHLNDYALAPHCCGGLGNKQQNMLAP
jgi:hypothetical protein